MDIAVDMVHGGALGTYRGELLTGTGLTAFLAELLPAAPGDPALYRRAFTHGSTGEAKDYQRLEFLGDRVLGLVIANWLYEHFPAEQEGSLSTRLNHLVSRECCAEIAKQLGVSEHIRMGKQARSDGGRESTNILGDVTEALIGAIYIDQGFDEATRFIRSHWQDWLEGDGKDSKHPKSILQEWAAQNQRKVPTYAIVDRSGPHHAPNFTVRVEITGLGTLEASGTSKQEAETIAARAFIEKYCT